MLILVRECSFLKHSYLPVASAKIFPAAVHTGLRLLSVCVFYMWQSTVQP